MRRFLFLDPQRCIGCRACAEACSECPDHGGVSMIHLDDLAPATSVQTAPTVCMHCEDPACASVCPADAIPKDERGVVHTAMAERCIGCGNCVLACPFGVPKLDPRRELMTKCDLCHHRASRDLAPMCATVCPSGALFWGTAAEVEDGRRARPLHAFRVGDAVVRTRNAYMVPAGTADFAIAPSGALPPTRAELSLEEVLL